MGTFCWIKKILMLGGLSLCVSVAANESNQWLVIDSFELEAQFSRWQLADTRNDTEPFVANPQVTVRQQEADGNFFLLKKPAADGVVGNRKALSYVVLPQSMPLGPQSGALRSPVHICRSLVGRRLLCCQRSMEPPRSALTWTKSRTSMAVVPSIPSMPPGCTPFPTIPVGE